MIDAFARFDHYADHIRPIWEAIPREHRGRWDRSIPPESTTPIMVAGWRDAKWVAHRNTIYVEHGAGQTYVVNGTVRLAPRGAPFGVKLAVLPNQTLADEWNRQFPSVATVVVGAPRLDGVQVQREQGLIGWTWHWPCRITPEYGTALPHYRHELSLVVGELREMGFDLLGTAHPRWKGRLWPLWDEVGVRWTHSSMEILRRCQVVIGDNSSLLYEAAALGADVIALNAPHYRRDVEHGLRFWSHPPGVMVDQPREVGLAVMGIARDRSTCREIADAATRRAYGPGVVGAADRAAAAILNWASA